MRRYAKRILYVSERKNNRLFNRAHARINVHDVRAHNNGVL